MWYNTIDWTDKQIVKKNCFQGYDYNRKTSKLFTWSISWSPTKMLLYNIVLVGDRTNLEFNFYRLWPSLNAFKIAPQYMKQLLIRCWIQRVKRSRKLKKKTKKTMLARSFGLSIPIWIMVFIWDSSQFVLTCPWQTLFRIRANGSLNFSPFTSELETVDLK